MIVNSLKQGWYWEDILIEERPTRFTLTAPEFLAGNGYAVDPISMDEASVSTMLVAGGIHVDMSVWGIPAEYDTLNIQGNPISPGLESGIYEVSARYYGQNNVQGPRILPDLGSPNIKLFIPPITDVVWGGSGQTQVGAGPSCLKMNVYLRLYDENLEYSFHEKALGVNIYLKQIESWEADINTSMGSEEYRICELSFEHGWKKIGDPTTGIETEYTPYSEIVFEQEDAPGIVSFNGLIGSIYENTSNSPFVFLGRPVESFYSTHGYEYTGTDLYRWKSATVHNMKAWIGNVARIQQKYDETGLGLEETGTIQRQSGDELRKSAHRAHDIFTDYNVFGLGVNDGDEIFSIESFADRLFICKKNKIIIINTSQEHEFVEDELNFGIMNYGCVTKTPHGVCFLNRNGVYLHTGSSVVNLTENKIDMDLFWREDLYAMPLDFQLLWTSIMPMIGYNARTDELFIYIQATSDDSIEQYAGDQDFEDWFFNLLMTGGSTLGLDWNQDGVVNVVDILHLLGHMDSQQFIHERASDFYIFSFITNTWTSSLPEDNAELDTRKTNFINYNSDLAYYDSKDGYVYKWNQEPYSSSGQKFKIQTKFMDFGFPSVRKKIKSITISYKGFKGTSVNDGSTTVQIYCYINQDSDTVILPVAESGSKNVTDAGLLGHGNDEEMCVFTNSTYGDLGISDNPEDYLGQIARISLPSESDDVYSISIVLAQGLDNSVDANFELYDITTVYQYMGVK